MSRRAVVVSIAATLIVVACGSSNEPERRLRLGESEIPIRCSDGTTPEFELIEGGARDWFGYRQRAFTRCSFELTVPEGSRLSFRAALDPPPGFRDTSATVAIHSEVSGNKRDLFLHDLSTAAPEVTREVALPAGTSTLSFWVSGAGSPGPKSAAAWTDLEIVTHSPDDEDGLPWVVGVDRALVPYLEATRESSALPTDRRRLLIIGVDGASWDLMEPLLEKGEMPALAELRERSRWGALRSSIVPESAMGWTALRTGVNPGKSGVYSFYDAPTKRRSFWHFLGDQGLTSIIVAVPTASSRRPLRGALIGGWADVQADAWAWPLDLVPVLERSGYRPHLRDERNPSYFIEAMRLRTRVASALLTHRDWDLAFVVFEYTDTVGHRFGLFTSEWDELYRALDANLAKLLEFADERTTVMLVSDHGWKYYDRSIDLNEWLRARGFPHWRVNLPASAGTLTISRKRTGRSAPPREGRAAFLDELERIEAGLAALRDPDTNEPVVRRVTRSEQAFSGPYADQAPGRLIVQARERYHLKYSVPRKRPRQRVHVFLGSEDAHAYDGVYLIAGAGIEPGPGVAASIYDVAPTVLEYFGITPPADSDGKALFSFTHATEMAGAPSPLYFGEGTVAPQLAEHEVSKDFEEDLRALGYIE